MPLISGPPPRTDDPNPDERQQERVYTSERGQQGKFRHGYLASLAHIWNRGGAVNGVRLDPVQTRWLAIQGLRTLISGLATPAGPGPTRLADIALLIGSDTFNGPDGKPHVDDDWFGPGSDHWWDESEGNIDAVAAEREIAQALLDYLLRSLSGVPAETTPWNGGDVQWPTGVSVKSDIVLEWHYGFGTEVKAEVEGDGDGRTFKFITPLVEASN